MRKLDPLSKIDEIMRQMDKGAFLTVQDEERLNTMTIGWATMGICWRKPVFMVAVRNSRYTFQIIESIDFFTVSLPSIRMQDEVFYCGTKSGREVDKFKECGLKTRRGQKVPGPVIDTPGIHLECRIVYKTHMEPKHLDPGLLHLYTERDFHTLYFGEILACYELDPSDRPSDDH